MPAGDRVVVATPSPPELGRDHNALPAPGDRAAEELLTLAVAVALGGVEQRDPGRNALVADVPLAPDNQPPAEVVAPDTDHGDAQAGTDDTLAHSPTVPIASGR